MFIPNVVETASATKAANDSLNMQKRRNEIRRRNLLVLIIQFLQDSGLYKAAKALEDDIGVPFNHLEPADNVDLLSILRDFEEYYTIKNSKSIRLVREVTSQQPKVQHKNIDAVAKEIKPNRLPKIPKEKDSKKQAEPEMIVSGKGSAPTEDLESKIDQCAIIDKLSTPLPEFESTELRELAQFIQRDIIRKPEKVLWTDIVGAEFALEAVHETLLTPLEYPNYYKGILKPWKAILIYGPPGNGKTLIAQAVSCQSKSTFFNISASTLVSKWRGESEKLVRMLFHLARHYAPSTIFFDEVESLLSSRSISQGVQSDHDSNKRMKTEIFIQMDGLLKHEDKQVTVLAATNSPWELDPAALRRFEKKIYISLPPENVRKTILIRTCDELVKEASFQLSPSVDFDALAVQTIGFSVAELKLIVKEAGKYKLNSPLYKHIFRFEYLSALAQRLNQYC